MKNLKNNAELLLKAVLVKKGILLTNRPENLIDVPITKLWAKDVLKATKDEARLLRPLIVLLVQHPTQICDFDNLPEELRLTVLALRAGKKEGPDYKFEKYRKLRLLCSISKDARVKGSDKKIPKRYRLAQDTISKIEELKSFGDMKTYTDVVEAAIDKLYKASIKS